MSGGYGNDMSREQESTMPTGWRRHERHCLLSKLDLPEGAVPCTCKVGRAEDEGSVEGE